MGARKVGASAVESPIIAEVVPLAKTLRPRGDRAALPALRAGYR